MKRWLVLAVLCVNTALAHAQTSTLPDGSTISFVRLYLQDDDGNLVQPTQTMPNDQVNGQPYFNYARCVCSDPNVPRDSDFKATSFGYLLQLQNSGQIQPTELTFPLQIWVGAECEQLATNPTLGNSTCHQITNAGVSSTATLQPSGITPVIPVYDLMVPEGPAHAAGAACQQRLLSANEYAIADTDSNGIPDFFAPVAVATDSLPPPTPTDITATSGESQITLSWKAVIGNTPDIAYYQALCIDPSGSAVSSSPPAPKYITPQSLCDAIGSNGSAGSDVNATLSACNFTDPDNPDECTALPTQVTPTDAGVPDAAPDAGSAAFVAPIAPAVDASTDVDAPIDAAVPINLTPLQQLPSAYICAQNVTNAAAATSLTITNLTDGVPYTIVLLSIDLYGNTAGVYINKTLVPKPVTDFWQDLHDKGSQVKGGFCLIAETYGDDNPLTNALRRFRDHTLADTILGRALIHAYYATLGKLGAIVHGRWPLRIVSGVLLLPFVLVALLWHWLTLPGLATIALLLWLRRRVVRSRALAKLATAGAALFVLALPARAHAQAPYWENQATGSDTDQAGFAEIEAKPKWHVGIKLGPYTPDIDSQSTMRNSAGQGPYKAMFGGAQVMPAIDLDRFLWTGIGQLGVGLSVAYMQKSAHPYVIPSDPDDPDRPRSSGDLTAFHLIPIAVTAVYRFTWFDDEYGVPVVPYARAGLGYYIWWSTINGHLSTDSMVSGKADGASAGLVGAVGISIRAERIDATAARAMRESGIAHAGFYGEVNGGWIDGFGKSTKLDVGALTWFAGIEMEF